MIYEFMATQSFNGYDKPWAPGAGPNLLDPENPDSITVIVGDTEVVRPGRLFDSLEPGKYVAKSCKGLTPSFYCTSQAKDADGWIGYPFYLAAGTNDTTPSVVYDVVEGMSLVICNVSDNADQFTSGVIGRQIELVKTDDTNIPYYTYANICPPEGFDIWDPDNQEYIQVYAGYVNSNTRELYLRPVYEEYAGEELVGPWMSSMDEYSEDATPTEGAFVIDFGGELTSYEITPFMLQTLLESLGIRQHFTDGAGLLNKLMDQAQGRVRSEEELLHLSRPLKVIAIGDQLPAGLTFKPISKDVLPGLPGKFIR